MSRFTADQKHEAIERELSYRRRLYPQRVAQGKMTEAFADKQIAIFEDILKDYEEGELL